MLKFKEFSSTKLRARNIKINKKYVESHPFNNCIHIISEFPLDDIEKPMYYFAKLPLTYFLYERREITAKSIGTFIDTDDVFVVYNRKMVLNLTDKTFQYLGLMGKKSKISKNRYIITIDLGDKNFKEGNKKYEKVLKAFLSYKKEIPFIIAGDKFEKEFQIETAQHSFLIKKEEFLSASQACPSVEFFNQLEKIQLNLFPLKEISGKEDSEDYILIYSYKWQGLIESSYISILLDKIKKGKGKAIVTVYGFEDSPISWRDKEHGFWISSGENHYILYFNNDLEEQVLFEIIGKSDQSI